MMGKGICSTDRFQVPQEVKYEGAVYIMQWQEKKKEINKWKLGDLRDESTHWKEGFKMNQLMLKVFLILKVENVTIFCYTF